MDAACGLLLLLLDSSSCSLVVVAAIATVIVMSMLVIAVSVLLLFAKRDLRQAPTSIVSDAHAAHSFGARAAS